MSNLLIVDDHPVIRDLLRMHLERGGYNVREAERGQQALDLVEKNKPDLIILDVMMPEMDGFETCRRLRSTSANDSIFIIILSAHAGREASESSKEAGADLCLEKPFVPKELLAHVASGLGQAKA